MTKKPSLSDKRIVTTVNIGDPDFFYWEKNLKKHIQNAKSRLKSELGKVKINKAVDKIFSEEFGDKLI